MTRIAPLAPVPDDDWFLAGGGECGALLRAIDWDGHPLGPPERWSVSLRTLVATVLSSKLPMLMAWGDALSIVYNDAYAPFLGARHPASMTGPFAQVWSDVWETVAPLVQTALGGEAVSKVEMHLAMERDGKATDTWWNFGYSPLRDDDGSIAGMLNIASDATAHVLSRRDAAAERERVRLLADAVPHMVWITNVDGTNEFFNRQWIDYTGQTWGANAETVVDSALHPDDQAATIAAFNQALAVGGVFEIEHRIRSKDGNYRWFLARAEPFVDPATGKVERYYGASVDIHERRFVEQALRDSEAEMRALYCDLERQVAERSGERGLAWTVNPDLLAVFDQASGCFERVNPAWTATLGWSAEELEGHSFIDFLYPDDLASTMDAFESQKDGEPVVRFVNRYRTKDGSTRWLQWVSVPEGGKLYSSARDVTDERARAELLTARTEERDFLATIVETNDAFITVLDLDYNILGINHSCAVEFERIYGVRPVAGDNMLALLDDQPEARAEVRALWSRALAGEEFTVVEAFGDPHRIRPFYELKFSTLRNSAGERVGAYQFVHDVTERLRREAQLVEAQDALRQAQKMEAMGQLTGGVAHDFNNLLTPIVGSLDLLMRRGLGNEREQRLISGAVQSAERARTLVQRLLAFARRQPLQTVAVDLGDLIPRMAGLIGSTIGPNIDVRVALDDGLPAANADPNQLEMAILNLAVNARDAMPDGGTLTVAARRVTAGADDPVAAGDYVLLSVADTGTGMDSETRIRSIEPFFSTKGIGKGTGLGLSMVHGLAAQLGGGLEIASVPGEGTTVSLWLPISAAGSLAATAAADRAAPAHRSRACVLLVDDEELVRMTTADMLAELGYDVVEATCAEDALRQVAGGLVPDLLVTDYLMPGMSGADLARTMRAERPALPVLIVSGYAESDGAAPEFPRLAKPFRNAELAERLAAIVAD